MYFRYSTREELKHVLTATGFTILRIQQRHLTTEHENQDEYFIVAKKPF